MSRYFGRGYPLNDRFERPLHDPPSENAGHAGHVCLHMYINRCNCTAKVPYICLKTDIRFLCHPCAMCATPVPSVTLRGISTPSRYPTTGTYYQEQPT